MSNMTKKEKDAIIAKGKADEAAKIAAEEAEEAEPEESEEEDEESEEESEDDSDDESEDDSGEDIDIDYEEIANAETKRANDAEEARKKAENALAEKNFNKRKNKRDGKEDDEADSDEDDKPITRKDLVSVISEITQQTQSKTRDADALRIAKANTKSEKEAQAALVFLRTRVQATDNLEEDVLSAIAIMNRKKVIAEKSEIMRSIKSKDNKSKDAAAANRQGSPAEKGKISSRDAAAITASGMVWDGVKRVYKKPLGNGKTFFYYDPKTKKRWKGK